MKMKDMRSKNFIVMIMAAVLILCSAFSTLTIQAEAAAANATVEAREKTYAQFIDELSDAMSRIGDHEVGKIEVHAKPYVSIGGRAVELLRQKEYTVLCIHYDKDGQSRDLLLTSADAALADENGYIGFEYAFNAHIRAVAKSAEAAGVTLPEGVEPVTWEVSSSNLLIHSAEAGSTYARYVAGQYDDIETIKNSRINAQIDSISAYYKGVYGNTADIDTPERKALRDAIKAKFLSAGSARTRSFDYSSGRRSYAYDGPLDKGYELELVLGLPASGKSSRVTDPDSEAMHAFILDCDEVKELIPEFQASSGAAADAVHFESFNIMDEAMKEFTEGSMKGTNVILPIVAGDFDDLMNNYIKPFEAAGYNVRAKFVEADVEASASRNIMRELSTGRIINSAVVLSFGSGPKEVFEKLAPMVNSKGVTYGYGYESMTEALDDAA